MNLDRAFRPKNGISLSDAVGIDYTANDPRVSSGNIAPVGSILIYSNGTLSKLFRKFGTGDTDWVEISAGLRTTTSDPTANSDVSNGFSQFDQIINTTTKTWFVCVDNTTANAVWLSSTSVSRSGIVGIPFNLAGAVISHNISNVQGFYLSIMVIPTEDVEIREMSFWCSASGTNYGTRMGVYSAGTNDVLLRETDNISGALSVGLNTAQLTQPITLTKNTRYMLALQSSCNAMEIIYRSGGLNTNSPAHLSRYDGHNAGNPTTGMQSSVSYSTTNRKLCISASY